MKLANWIHAEWQLSISRPSYLLLTALFVALLLYAVGNGRTQLDGRLQAIERNQSETAAAMATWLENLSLLESGAAADSLPARTGSAMDLRFATQLPQPPLADFATGQSDILPYLATVSLSEPDIRMFSRYGFDEPTALMLGKFDLATAIIIVLPLLLIVLCFDVISADRGARRLHLNIAQGVTINRLFWTRLLIRSTLLLLILLAVMILALVLPAGHSSLAERLPAFLS